MLYVLSITKPKEGQHIFVDSTSQQPAVTVFLCIRTHKLEVSVWWVIHIHLNNKLHFLDIFELVKINRLNGQNGCPDYTSLNSKTYTAVLPFMNNELGQTVESNRQTAGSNRRVKPATRQMMEPSNRQTNLQTNRFGGSKRHGNSGKFFYK